MITKLICALSANLCKSKTVADRLQHLIREALGLAQIDVAGIVDDSG